MTGPGSDRPVLGWALSAGAAALLAEARRRWQAGHRGDRVLLQVSLTPEQRRDVGRLMGLKWLAEGKPVALGQLRAAIRRAEPDWDLPDVLTAVGGTLVDERAEKEQAAVARAGRREQLVQILSTVGVPAQVAELAVARRWFGGIDDPATAGQARELARVLTALPSRTDRLLASIASELLSDPHALDRTSVLGRSAVRVLAGMQAAEAGGDVAAAVRAVAAAASWRETWAAAGVTCDQVSSTVLVLNVPLPGATIAATLARSAAQSGEPLWLTARMLRPDWVLELRSLAGLLVRVCENPSLVEAAADRYGAAALPLICTYGRPSGAAWALLRGVVLAGARLKIGGDRDPAGRAITRSLLDGLPGAEPWLPEVAGLYEEDRLTALLADLSPGS